MPDPRTLDTPINDGLFFDASGLNRPHVERLVAQALHGACDGELYLEYSQAESLVFNDRQLKSAAFDTTQGFGLRLVAGEATGYAHSNEISEAALGRAAHTVAAARHGHSGAQDVSAAGHAPPPALLRDTLYGTLNPLAAVPFAEKVKTLVAIDEYARSLDARVKQVSVSLGGSWRAVTIMRGEGAPYYDIRPLVHLGISIVTAQGERMEGGSTGSGGRTGYARYLDPENWQQEVREALRRVLVNLDSRPAPAGEMPVVLGPGWPGVLLHEAIGHGLEGDFNRKKTSAFSGLMGSRIAAPGVTVVDDGTLAGRRGSLNLDDEGTPSQRTTLIEDGILVGYLQDRLNARLMGMQPTGNGRRQSYGHCPMPRMTNTFMLAGQHSPEEMIASIPRGLYAVNFGGGQVDITSGKFVFSTSEAYLIEDGKIGPAVTGATLIGNGPDVLTKIAMIGNDFALDPGIGACGKNGQSVPVGVGQPSLLLTGLTVGGTAT